MEKFLNIKPKSTPPPNTIDTQGRLPREFFTVDVVTLAEKLLNKIIVKKTVEGEYRFKIVETEAYKAPDDKACHAYNNKKTNRTKYFWQIGGCLYVYSIYGHCCLNITAATAEEPEAVLIRGLQAINKIDELKAKRKCKKDFDIANGPGKIGDALELTLEDNGIDLCKSNDFYIIDNDNKEEIKIAKSKRINIDYAEEWKDKEWRFYIENNKYVSKCPSISKKKK